MKPLEYGRTQWRLSMTHNPTGLLVVDTPYTDGDYLGIGAYKRLRPMSGSMNYLLPATGIVKYRNF